MKSLFSGILVTSEDDDPKFAIQNIISLYLLVDLPNILITTEDNNLKTLKNLILLWEEADI